MAKKQRSAAGNNLASALRATALDLPETEEGIACAGTSLEKRTIKVSGKAFLFLGKADAMLKLSDSLSTATKLAAEHPDHCKVGAHGWTTIKFADTPVSSEQLQSWIVESYRLLAPATKAPISKQAKAAAKTSQRK
jgi:hypothetical protein